MPDLRDLTTLRVGGPIDELVVARTEPQLVDAVRAADAAARPVLLIGGGSNLVASDAGWRGVGVLIRTRGRQIDLSSGRALLTVAAGEPWADLVDTTVADGLAGLETLAGIPGLAGATPVQNVGAYGTEVAALITSVRVFDRADAQITTFTAAQCGFGYRTSLFKHTDRYVVLSVSFALDAADSGRLSRPIAYAELARALDVQVGHRAPTDQVRAAVLELRRAKGMLLDGRGQAQQPDDRTTIDHGTIDHGTIDHDTWSVGSFFTNPVVEQATGDLEGCPHWPADGGVKLSAAWLIEHAGFGKGYGSGPARISTKHTLALTNRGHASAQDVIALAREIVTGVRERFGVTLSPEPRLVGVAL